MQWVLLIAVVLLAALTVVALLNIYNLILQNGRLLIRLDHMEEALFPPPGPEALVEEYLATMPPGREAPPFALPDLNGVVRRIDEWRGQRVLLVFVDPECAFSRRLVPWLVGATRDVVPGRPLPVIVSTGSLEANRALFDEAGFTGAVLLQRDTEVAAAYRVDGTPMSYLIEADGVVAADAAIGVQSILLQAGEVAVFEDALPGEPVGLRDDGFGARLDAPAARQDGLRRGETAPLFRLPGVNVEEVSLLDFRGRPTVVVFTDPECDACEQVGPTLEAVHRTHPDLGILLVSRGDPALTREQVAAEGLTFPVALQRHWEVSRRYGMFALPVAFLLDEWGVVSTDMAVGSAGITQLLEAGVVMAGN
ncbi:MAG: redoxin domain-containing protein [Dehalococcoidia bacterium]